MATAEEQFRLLTDSEGLGVDQILQLQTEQITEQLRREQQLAQSAQVRQAPQPSAAQIRQQQEAQAQQVDIDRRAGTLLNQRIEQLNLSEDEKRLVRIDGTLDKALQRYLTLEERRANGNSDFDVDQRAVLGRARELLNQDYENFVAATDQEQVPIVRPEQNPLTEAQVDELLQGDEPVADFIGRTLGTGLGGLLGLAAIPTAIANESAGQALGAAARNTREFFDNPDIASVAAQRSVGDVIARTQLPEDDPNRLTIGQAVLTGAQEGFDADFILDTLAGTVGALAGGGAVGGAARVGGVVAGRLGAQGVAQAGQRVGAANQAVTRATAGAPAVGVGIGSGVDENINRPQAAALAGTIGTSALFGRFSPLGTVESTVAQGVGNAARQGLATSAARVGAGEAVQEFIEGAGESFAGRAGRLGSLSEAAEQGFSQDIATGAVAAPLGAALGSGFGAGGAVANNVNVARGEQAIQAQEDAQRQRLTQAAAQAQAELDADAQAQVQAQATASQVSAADQARVQLETEQAAADERVNQFRQRLDEVLPQEVPAAAPVLANDPNVRLDQLGQTLTPEQVPGSQLGRFFPADNPEILTESIVEVRENPDILRALLRNDTPDALQATEDYAQLETSLVEQIAQAQTVGDVQTAIAGAQSSILELSGVSPTPDQAIAATPPTETSETDGISSDFNIDQAITDADREVVNQALANESLTGVPISATQAELLTDTLIGVALQSSENQVEANILRALQDSNQTGVELSATQAASIAETFATTSATLDIPSGPRVTSGLDIGQSLSEAEREATNRDLQGQRLTDVPVSATEVDSLDPVLARDVPPTDYTSLRESNPLLEGLTPEQRSELKNAGFQRNADATTIKRLTAKDNLTEEEQTSLDQAIRNQKRRIDAKKPQPLDNEGTQTSRPVTPRQPGSARPVSLVRPERLPSGQSEGQAAQSLSTPDTAATNSVANSVASSVDRLTSGWTPKARGSVKVISADDPILAQNGIDPAQSAGFTDGKTAYIIADSITSDDQLSAVLGEEIFHRGFMVANGGNYNAVLDNIFKKRNGTDGLLELARQFNAGQGFEQLYSDVIARAQNGDKEAQREFTDEVLASIATQPNLPPSAISDIRRITTKLRGYVRRLLGQNAAEAMSDEEILKLVREANAAGRTGEGSNINVVRRNRIQGNEFLGRDANGNTVYRNVSNQFRPSTRTQDDIYAKVARFINGTRNLSQDQIREQLNSDLGGKFLNSKPYKAVVRRIANASNKLALISREFTRGPQGVGGDIVQQIIANLPDTAQQPLLRSILSRYDNPEAAFNVMDIESRHSRYSAMAAQRMTEEKLSDGTTMMDRIQESQRALEALTAHLGESPVDVRNTVMRDMQARHTAERNDISFLKNVDLQAAPKKVRDRRKELAQLMEDGLLDQEGMSELRRIVEEHKAQPIEQWRKGTGMTNAEAQQVQDQIAADYSDQASQQLFEDVRQSLYKVIDGTNQVRNAQGAMSANQKAAIELYGWKNYIPMRGEDVDAEDSLGIGPKFSEDVYAQTFKAFEGTEHVTNDTLAAIYNNAVVAYENREAQETFIDSVLLHTAGNTVSPLYRQTFQRDGNGGDLLAGSIKEYEINSKSFARLMATKNPRLLIRYNPDNARLPKGKQTAVAIILNESEASDAVFSKRSEGADMIDRYLRMTSKVHPFGDQGIHELTRFVASLKTSRNPAFIPYDAIRTVLTGGWDIASNEGFGAFRDYMGQYLHPRQNFPVWKYVTLRTQGKFNELNAMVEEAGENSELAQLHEFFRLGGPSNPIQALQDRGTGGVREQAIGATDPENLSNLQKMDQVFQIANQGTDLLTRFGMYKTLLRQGQTPERAAARAKNLSNFERRGTWSGPGSALFEFFNTTAIGGTALIHSTLTGRYGAQTMGAAAGAGFGTYLLLNALMGKDDNDDDRMGKINGRLFTNNMVIQYGDKDTERLQFGFGFGPVASALSSGIQLARLLLGHQSTADTVDNASLSFTSQANILPLSGISPTDSPLSFAFDTAVPSVVKPFFQLMTNMSSLGIPVYSDWAGDWLTDGASLEGRLGSEAELYEETAQQLRRAGVDINPDALRHLGRSYLGGLAGLGESVFEQLKYARGQSEGEVNLKNVFYLPRQFFGSDYGQLDQDFYTQFDRVRSLDDRVKSLTNRNLTEEARSLADSEVYRNNLGLYEQTNRELTTINREYNALIRDESQPINVTRELRRQRDAARAQLMRQFIDRFQD